MGAGRPRSKNEAPYITASTSVQYIHKPVQVLTRTYTTALSLRTANSSERTERCRRVAEDDHLTSINRGAVSKGGTATPRWTNTRKKERDSMARCLRVAYVRSRP